MTEHAPFEGFVPGPAVTLPAQLFTEVLPDVEDVDELRVALYALFAIQRGHGRLRAVRASELLREPPLARAFEGRGGTPALLAALDRAVARGLLVATDLGASAHERVYAANSEAGRRALVSLEALDSAGSAGRVARVPAWVTAAPRGAPEAAYEREIGALTPAIADALAAARERYSDEWIIEAIEVAARRNARSWRYAEAVLRRWRTEGKTPQRGDEHGRPEGPAGGATTAGGADPDLPQDPYRRVVRRSWP